MEHIELKVGDPVLLKHWRSTISVEKGKVEKITQKTVVVRTERYDLKYTVTNNSGASIMVYDELLFRDYELLSEKISELRVRRNMVRKQMEAVEIRK